MILRGKKRTALFQSHNWKKFGGHLEGHSSRSRETKFFSYLVQLVVHSGNAPPLFFLFEQEDDFSFCRSNADWYEAPIKANFLFYTFFTYHFSHIIC